MSFPITPRPAATPPPKMMISGARIVFISVSSLHRYSPNAPTTLSAAGFPPLYSPKSSFTSRGGGSGEKSSFPLSRIRAVADR